MSSSSPRRVRLGFIGAGTMGQAAHLRNYASLRDDCEVVALAEPRPAAAAEVAARYGIPRVYPTHEELLAAEKVDALVASQPFTRHGVLVPELARAGVPIFTEKPIAGSVETAKTILRALDKHGVWLMVGYHKRCDPATLYAKAEIEGLKRSGEIGRLRYVRITMPVGDWIAGGLNENLNTGEIVANLVSDPPPRDMDEDMAKRYFVFVNFYIHQVNLLRHLLGEDYEVTHADPGEMLLVARSRSGVTGVIELNPYATSIDWQESALVGFERGYVKLELPAPLAVNRPGRVEILRDPGGGATPLTSASALPHVHAMRSQAIHFLKAVRGEAPAPCLAPEALRDLQIARDYIRALKGT